MMPHRAQQIHPRTPDVDPEQMIDLLRAWSAAKLCHTDMQDDDYVAAQRFESLDRWLSQDGRMPLRWRPF